jgi:CelD/BcsL family acetyltransferase involved in cellulose biosynthesis
MSKTDTQTLTCRIISDAGNWESLAPNWGGLLLKTPEATPWQSMAWLTPWWKQMGGSRRLMITVVLRGDSPCLILPLQVGESRIFGLPVRLLEPIGMPDDINRPALALGPRDETAALDCALEALWERRSEWDGIRIDEKAQDDAEVAALARFARQNDLVLRIPELHPCPRLDLRQDWTSYLATRGRLLRRNLRTYRKQLEAQGPIRLQIADNPQEVDAAFDTFLQIQSRSWKQQAELSLSQATYQQCYREFLLTMAREGRARVLIMYSGAHPVAGAIAAMDDKVYYGAQIAHDADFNRYSPGTLLEAMELEGLMQEKRFESYDFFGAALSNKRRWTEDLRPTCRVLLLRKTLAARLFDGWYFWCKPRLRDLHQKLQTRNEQKQTSPTGEDPKNSG